MPAINSEMSLRERGPRGVGAASCGGEGVMKQVVAQGGRCTGAENPFPSCSLFEKKISLKKFREGLGWWDGLETTLCTHGEEYSQAWPRAAVFGLHFYSGKKAASLVLPSPHPEGLVLGVSHLSAGQASQGTAPTLPFSTACIWTSQGTLLLSLPPLPRGLNTSQAKLSSLPS